MVFWADIDYRTLFTIMHGHPHPVTQAVVSAEEKQLEKMLGLYHNIVWPGIGTGDLLRTILYKTSLRPKVIGIDVNKSLLDFARYNLYNLCELELVHSDVLDCQVELRDSLCLLDFGTFGNLDARRRKAVCNMASEAGGVLMSVFAPEDVEQHISRYRHDISFGMADSFEVEEHSDGNFFEFKKGDVRVHSFHPSQEYLEKSMGFCSIKRVPFARLVVRG